MKVELTKPGTYIVAVSGGVDSMVLLHALHYRNLSFRSEPWRLVVAHLDHGIRSGSHHDRLLVQKTARKLGLPFIYMKASLGGGTSEADARAVRYDFLHKAKYERGGRAIVTAHHQDDVLETAIINLLRGSGRKGLTSLASKNGIERPLLDIPKDRLVTYAQTNNIQWREDASNQDTDYLRNYVRHRLLPRFNDDGRQQLREIITGLRTTNTELDEVLAHQLAKWSAPGRLDRNWFIQLPHKVAREVMAAWLRDRGLRNFDRKTLERLVVAAKTAAPGKAFDVLQHRNLEVGKDYLALVGHER